MTTLTTATGAPVADNQNSKTAGPRGPVLIEDFHLVEKLQHFNRERVPERVVHAKGSGAYGVFEVTNDITRYTRADLFAQVGRKTDVFIRFSTVGGEKGSADTERDPRGFAIKFYTNEGNWDLVGNNTPVFFIRDGIKFPDFIHTQKRDPRTNMKNPTAMWDFWSLSPESLHQVTTLFSDRGTPDGYRAMHGFGSHTFSMIDAQGRRVWVKYHVLSLQGIRNLHPRDATRLAGQDPDYAQRDLFEAIERGDYPKWRFCIQVMTEEQARATPYDPFDLTKVWPHADFPLIEVGVITLNRNPENYFAEVEQAAFSPSAIVRGLGFSPDKMLQARLFAYHDAHLYRVGTNSQALPVNRPHAPVRTYQRDGAMRFDGNFGGAANYEPNSVAGSPRQDAAHAEPPLPLAGAADRYDHRAGNDDYTQAGDLFRLMSADQQALLVENIINAMKTVPREIQERQIAHFAKADPRYGAGVAKGLGFAASSAKG